MPCWSAGSAYITNVVAALGAVSYYTIGISQHSEAIYPTTSSNQWWAFNQSAQGGTGRPAGEAATPLPGWVPGTATWHGEQLTNAQVQAWYAWYQGGLVNAVAWEIRTIRAAGFDGNLELQLPGDGANPWVYTNRVMADLAPESYDAYDTLNAGAVYQVLLARLPDLAGVVMDVTSVGDESGTPADNACQSSDAAVLYAADSAVDNGLRLGG